MAGVEAPLAAPDPAPHVAAEGGVVGQDAPAEPVEEWVSYTMSTLGRFVDKPRMLPDRLRKPPFRFLFDVSVEVCRQTGFGLSELFSGNLPAKPAAPASREQKIAFLEQWVHLLQYSLGPQVSGVLTNVNANDVVCGMRPEWTNYMLQCTAAAAYPDQCAAQQPVQVAPVVLPTSVQLQPTPQAEAALEPLVGPPLTEAATIEQEQPLQPPLGEQPSPTPNEGEQPPVETWVPLEQEVAAADPLVSVEHVVGQVDAAMQQVDQLQSVFAATAEKWNFKKPLDDDLSDDDSSIDSDLLSPSPAKEPRAQRDPSEAPEQESAARAPLSQAMERATRVDQEMKNAMDLLDQIEEGFDQTDAFGREKRAAAEEARRQADAKLREALEREEAIAEAADQEKAEKTARKAARKAEKERLRAQAEQEALERAKEEERQKMFPVSKHSMAQGARIVACLNEDEYQWDGDDTEPVEEVQAAAPAPVDLPLSPSAPAEGGEDAGVADFDLSAALGEDPHAAVPTLAQLGTMIPQGESALFEKIKCLMKETYVSYLCASMPEFLLKQYQPADLVGCLQFLLTELRKCLSKHSLEDIMDEEPTTLAEDMREKYPADWLMPILDASALTLCSGGRYEATELVDTLQSLSQTCFDRLEENVGSIQCWAEEGSPLRYVPPLEPITVETPPAAEAEDRTFPGYADTEERAQAPGPWSSELAPAPWEEPTMAVPSTSHGMHASSYGTATGFRTVSASPPPQARSNPSPTPNFDSSLGPAIWDQHGPTVVPLTAAGPHAFNQASRHATAAPGMRGPLTAAPLTAFGQQHPATSHGLPQRGHYVASR